MTEGRYVRENGNRIEDTLYGHMLILSGGSPFGGTFAFRSTGAPPAAHSKTKRSRSSWRAKALAGSSSANG